MDRRKQLEALIEEKNNEMKRLDKMLNQIEADQKNVAFLALKGKEN